MLLFTMVSCSPDLTSLISSPQMQFMLLFSRQGKLRLQKWYVPLSDKEKKKITRELVQTVLARKPKMCSFLEWRDLKIVYKRSVELLAGVELCIVLYFNWWKNNLFNRGSTVIFFTTFYPMIHCPRIHLPVLLWQIKLH